MDRAALLPSPRAGRAPRAGPRGAARGGLATRPVRAAGDDGRDRHAVVQLPGPAPPVCEVHLARDRVDLRPADDRDGRRLGLRRARRGRAQPRHPAAARRLGAPVRRRRARRRRGAHAARAGAAPRAAGRGERDVRRGRQLVAAARRDRSLARARDVAVLRGLPRLDADRRAAGRLARAGVRAACRARARRGRGARHRRRGRMVVAPPYAIPYSRT